MNYVFHQNHADVTQIFHIFFSKATFEQKLPQQIEGTFCLSLGISAFLPGVIKRKTCQKKKGDRPMEKLFLPFLARFLNFPKIVEINIRIRLKETSHQNKDHFKAALSCVFKQKSFSEFMVTESQLRVWDETLLVLHKP